MTDAAHGRVSDSDTFRVTARMVPPVSKIHAAQ
jgi:hypothetical protein